MTKNEKIELMDSIPDTGSSIVGAVLCLIICFTIIIVGFINNLLDKTTFIIMVITLIGSGVGFGFIIYGNNKTKKTFRKRNKESRQWVKLFYSY